jgi:hypothetical protein
MRVLGVLLVAALPLLSACAAGQGPSAATRFVETQVSDGSQILHPAAWRIFNSGDPTRLDEEIRRLKEPWRSFALFLSDRALLIAFSEGEGMLVVAGNEAILEPVAPEELPSWRADQEALYRQALDFTAESLGRSPADLQMTPGEAVWQERPGTVGGVLELRFAARRGAEGYEGSIAVLPFPKRIYVISALWKGEKGQQAYEALLERSRFAPEREG